jgi:transposase
MAKSYRAYFPDAELLLPPSLRDWLPDNHLAYFVSDVVDNLDLSLMDAVYGNEKRGQPPYDPQMMTKILIYGYCVGVFSSRRIERRLVEDIAFRVPAGNQPNFRTISDFRKIHLKTLESLFEQVLKITLEAGAMKIGQVALDGTKVKANASKHKAMSYDRMKEKEKELRDEVKDLLARAEAAADAEEDTRYGKDRTGDELPSELQRRETRLKKVREAKRALEARARAKAVAEGFDPKTAKPKEKDQYNFTDPESRIMKGADGFIQGYNAQTAVEPDLQLTVGQGVTAAANDKEQLLPMLDVVEQQSGQKTGRGSGRQWLLLRKESGGTGFRNGCRSRRYRICCHGTAETW